MSKLLIIPISIFLLVFIGGSMSDPEFGEVDLEVSKVNPRSDDLSTWLWDSPDTFSDTDLVKILETARDEKITTIYLRVDDYAYVYGMDLGEERDERLRELNEDARRFITKAREYGIEVQALGGDVDWAESDQVVYARSFFDAVLAYNASSTPHHRFSGIQFDVEPHNSNGYKKDKMRTLETYLDFALEMLVKRRENNSVLTGRDFYIGFAIPSWYDNENDNGVSLDWGGRGVKPAGYHLFDILEQYADGFGYIALMNYRNHAEGRDGSIENGLKEMEYLFENTPNVTIVMGQETTDVSPTRITFHDTSKRVFKREVRKIVSEFEKYPQFAGIAIHHLKSYIDL